MTDPNTTDPRASTPPRPGPALQDSGLFGPGWSNVQLIYVLYLLSFAFGITYIIGVVMAYMSRGDRALAFDTHYRYQIGTFWWGILYLIIATVLMVVGIGFLLFPVIAIWFVIRCIKGLLRAQKREPIDEPGTWLI